MGKAKSYNLNKWVRVSGNILLFSIIPFISIAQQVKSKPNIIYIYADDLGYGELGSYGQTKIKTPHLDQMAKEGMRFTQHYSGAPVCAPSRSILMTGKHSGHSYIRGNYELGGFADSLEGGQMPLHEGAYTVARMLKERGYSTALVGKWGMGVTGTTGSPLNHGFDYYYGYLDQKQAHNFYPTHLWENDNWDALNNHVFSVHGKIDPKTATDSDFEKFRGKDYAPAKMTQKALGFLEKNKEKPFFLYLAFPLPHLALQAPEEYVKKYVGQFDEKPYFGENGYAPNKYPLSTYAAMITFLDDQVGIIMERIKKLGLDENTIIMFSSDNGATFSAGVDTKFFNSVSGLRGLKMDLYEGGIRVPFIARWPNKIKANTVNDHVSGQFDIMATLAEISGKKISNTDGISLLPELTGRKQEQQKHGFLYFEYPENGGQLAVRIGNWKGVKTNVRKEPNANWELFDLSKDRNEKTDIASDNPEIIAQMKAIVKREHIHPHILDWEFIDSKIMKK
ncbi:Arylsulfatase A [Daejeonella rubra]|uniref:Arylsulfatase A n=1 Tax=Daejeonella rubra TaxID=990371 RepID=A0A1G9UMV1_9SPHI|nr:arylsulfatase [Daejeonella rubra]SDM61236.1 Arylsulfatase A [Daejeonella rubra]